MPPIMRPFAPGSVRLAIMARQILDAYLSLLVRLLALLWGLVWCSFSRLSRAFFGRFKRILWGGLWLCRGGVAPWLRGQVAAPPSRGGFRPLPPLHSTASAPHPPFPAT